MKTKILILFICFITLTMIVLGLMFLYVTRQRNNENIVSNNLTTPIVTATDVVKIEKDFSLTQDEYTPQQPIVDAYKISLELPENAISTYSDNKVGLTIDSKDFTLNIATVLDGGPAEFKTKPTAVALQVDFADKLFRVKLSDQGSNYFYTADYKEHDCGSELDPNTNKQIPIVACSSDTVICNPGSDKFCAIDINCTEKSPNGAVGCDGILESMKLQRVK